MSRCPTAPFQTALQASAQRKGVKEQQAWSPECCFTKAANWKLVKKKKKSISIRPATSLQSYMFPAAASALRCHEVIKLIHNYQTLPFSTNESPQSIFLQSLKRNRDLQPSSMAAVCSEVARPGRTSQHAKEVTWSHHFSTFKFKEEKTINGVGELHRPSGLHNYNHNANVHIHKLTCPWLFKLSETDGLKLHTV